jgi:L-amino acid N-acyltransferase YncA
VSAEGLEFREATSDDWPSIWPIFRAVVAAGDTYTYPPDTPERDAGAAWMPMGRVHHKTYVALLEGVVAGSAYLKPNQPGPGDHVANAGWMISAAYSGRGIGRQFAEYVIDQARVGGYLAMQFNAVVASNERAISLWNSLGFEIVGTVPDAFRHPSNGPTAIHIMHRLL